MTEDKSWKPKRTSDGSTESQAANHVVEISVQSSECKAALEKAFDDIPEVTINKGPARSAASIVVLELSDKPKETFETIREMVQGGNGPEIFLTAPSFDSAVLLEAMRTGAKEFFTQPIQKKEVLEAVGRYLERATVKGTPSTERRKEGKILAFFGGKGGVGTTSIAVNLAASLNMLPSKPSVVLVDVNQHGGDLPLYLDIQPTHSFRDISADLSRLDQAFLLRVLAKTEMGIHVLPSGYDDLSTGRLNPDCVEATLNLLKTRFDYVVLDCGHVLDLTTKKALEVANSIMVTSTLMVPVVHRTKRILELLRGSGFPQSKIQLVMNRYLSAEQDVLHETEEILKQKAFWLIPNDYPSASQSVNGGKPLIDVAPRSAVAKTYRELACSFDGTTATVAKKGLVSWLNPFKSRQVESAATGV